MLNLHDNPPDRYGTDPVVGWRVWYADDGGALYSPRPSAPDRLWQPGAPFEASCWVTDCPAHPAPNLDCGHCGVHAWKESLNSAVAYGLVKHDPGLLPVGFHPVYGQVALWGRVIEHEDGWRGQFAYPTMLRVYDGDLARRLYQTYGVETEALGE